MKISVSLYLMFNNPEHALEGQVEVRGTLNCSDRPLAGETIYWPYLDYSIEDPHDQDCCLYVVDSGFHTVDPGKISPRIVLECRGSGDDQNDRVREVIKNFDDWKCVHGAIHLFLNNPTVRWGEDYNYVPLLTEPSLPSDLSKNFK